MVEKMKIELDEKEQRQLFEDIYRLFDEVKELARKYPSLYKIYLKVVKKEWIEQHGE